VPHPKALAVNWDDDDPDRGIVMITGLLHQRSQTLNHRRILKSLCLPPTRFRKGLDGS
jgi:hypothetical protein